MGNSWYYRLWFGSDAPESALQGTWLRLAERLRRLDVRPRADAGFELFFSRAGDGVTLFASDLDDDFFLSLDPAARALCISRSGNPRPEQPALDARMRELFLWLCENEHPVFGHGEDEHSVENLWHDVFGVAGSGLLDVGRREHDDIRSGRLPPALPWLTYYSHAHFPEAEAQLRGVPAGMREPLGAGTLLALSSGPWDCVFLVKREGEETYAVLDAAGEPRTLERI